MALRRQEDLVACAVINAAAIHLPFLEAPHRGYASAKALFAGRHMDDDVLEPLTGALGTLVQDLAPDLLLGPLAIGDHVDHWIVRHALALCQHPYLLWEDWPYLRRTDRCPERMDARCHRLTPLDRSTRLQMCAAYESQLAFQFGGVETLEQQNELVEEECLHAHGCPDLGPTR